MNQIEKRTQIVTAIITGLTTLTIALLTGWLTLAGEAISRDETIELIEARTPYVLDREALKQSIELNTRKTEQLSELTRELERQNVRVEAKLDLLLTRLVGEGEQR